jgi:hypothetical protein
MPRRPHRMLLRAFGRAGAVILFSSARQSRLVLVSLGSHRIRRRRQAQTHADTLHRSRISTRTLASSATFRWHNCSLPAHGQPARTRRAITCIPVAAPATRLLLTDDAVDHRRANGEVDEHSTEAHGKTWCQQSRSCHRAFSKLKYRRVVLGDTGNIKL